jgi:hypothetical protein
VFTEIERRLDAPAIDRTEPGADDVDRLKALGYVQ